ncbi:hypothetical protein PF003_g9719 [Phytophthora fragariae]|nr:hypothetical protein PF003_g9719 [Phytophthora fragariae]
MLDDKSNQHDVGAQYGGGRAAVMRKRGGDERNVPSERGVPVERSVPVVKSTPA